MELAAYSEHQSSISIVELPKVRWNPQVHSKTFTGEFKRQAQAVLLCQHRLHRQLGKNSGAHFGELPQVCVSMYIYKHHQLFYLLLIALIRCGIPVRAR